MKPVINFEKLTDIFEECFKLSKQKNTDYGCEPLIKHGETGILVRISDKIARLENLYTHNNVEPQTMDEKIEDTLKDIINYSAYLILMTRGELLAKFK